MCLQPEKNDNTYGTISSSPPARNSIGMSVTLGNVSSEGQIWWHRNVRYLAGGSALCLILALKFSQPASGNLRRNKFFDRQECVLQDNALDITGVLIPRSQGNRHRSSKTLPI